MKLDDLDLIGLLAVMFIVVIAIVCLIVSHESKRKGTGFPKPQHDPRDWHGAFMRDWKRR